MQFQSLTLIFTMCVYLVSCDITKFCNNNCYEECRNKDDGVCFNGTCQCYNYGGQEFESRNTIYFDNKKLDILEIKHLQNYGSYYTEIIKYFNKTKNYLSYFNKFNWQFVYKKFIPQRQFNETYVDIRLKSIITGSEGKLNIYDNNEKIILYSTIVRGKEVQFFNIYDFNLKDTYTGYVEFDSYFMKYSLQLLSNCIVLNVNSVNDERNFLETTIYCS